MKPLGSTKPASLQLIRIVDKAIIAEWARGIDYACVHIFARLAEVKPGLQRNLRWDVKWDGKFQECCICYPCDKLSPVNPDGSRNMRTPIDGPTGTMEGWSRRLTSKEQKANEKEARKRIRAGKKISKGFRDGQTEIEV